MSEAQPEKEGEPELPVAEATGILADIAEQAPFYGLSGAILAVGLVTGRRALARSGARLLVGEALGTLSRVLGARAQPAPAKPVEAAKLPPTEPVAMPKPSSMARLAAGAIVGGAATAVGGWLIRRMLAPRAEQAKDES